MPRKVRGAGGGVGRVSVWVEVMVRARMKRMVCE